MVTRPPLAERLGPAPPPAGGWLCPTWQSAVSCSPEGYAGPRISRVVAPGPDFADVRLS